MAIYYGFIFRPIEIHQTGKRPLDVAAGDLNSDGNNDVVTANRDGRSLSIFMGNGDGTLTPINPVRLKAGATSLALGDLTGDGKLDIAATVCDSYCNHNGVLILHGVGDGTFEREEYLPVEGVPYNLTLADLNSDGLLDLAASDAPNDRVIIMVRRGSNWEFSTEYSATADHPISLAASDVNHDGFTDLIAGAQWDDQVSVHLMNQSGTVQEIKKIETEDLPYTIALERINSDDHLDLVVGHSSEPGMILSYWGDGAGNFERGLEVETSGRLIFVAGGDFNLDGRADLITTSFKQNFSSIYLQNTNGTFETTPISLPSNNRIYSLVLTELNGDGIPDLASVDYDDDTLSVSIGQIE